MLSWFTSPIVKDSLDGLNKIAQILALAVAGYWGYHLYVQTSKPGTELRGSTQTDVDWSEGPNSDSCLGSFHAHIKNDGIRSFNVRHYVIQAWLFSRSELIKKQNLGSAGTSDSPSPAFVNYDDIQKTSPFYKEDVDKDGGLLGHYPPSQDSRLSWDFFFPKNKDQGVLFSIDADMEGDSKSHSQSWKADAVCPNPLSKMK